MAQERADALKDQFIMDMHTHFCATTRASRLSCVSASGGQGGLEPGADRQAADHRGPEVEQLLKEVSRHDTKIALISSARRRAPRRFLTTR